jgi:hypothetical protein
MAKQRKTVERADGIPRRLKLALVEATGLTVMVVGAWMLVSGNLIGLFVVAFGADLVIRPTARRLPRRGALTDFLVRWRNGPGLGPPSPPAS